MSHGRYPKIFFRLFIFFFSNLFLILGEGASNVRESLANEILPTLLNHTSIPVRFYSSLCYRCLATALPAHLAHMISEANTRLKAVVAAKSLEKSADPRTGEKPQPQVIRRFISISENSEFSLLFHILYYYYYYLFFIDY